MRERYFCGLDIGSQTIKASIIQRRDDSHLGVLGVFETKTGGFKNSSISDLAELAECIHAAISGLLKKAGVKLKNVQLGIGPDLIEGRVGSAVIPLVDRGNKVISSQDIKRVQGQARLLGAKMDELILHEFPQHYRVDDVNIALNPVGLFGRKLELHTLFLTVNNTMARNLTKAVNQAGYDVSNLFFASYASACASLPENKRCQDCAFVDIGASTTGVLVFENNRLTSFDRIPVGGEQVTQRIAHRLKLGDGLAEEIKKSYAVVLNAEDQSDEEILIKRQEGYLPIRKAVISEAIEPVIKELTQAIVKSLKASAVAERGHDGIVLSGGGVLLAGLPERIEQESHWPVQIGRIHVAVRRFHNLAKFTAAIGLAQQGMYRSHGRVSPLGSRGDWWCAVANKIKDMYQEYF